MKKIQTSYWAMIVKRQGQRVVKILLFLFAFNFSNLTICSAEYGLHRAIQAGQTNIWRKLLKEGSNVHLKDASGNTPLHLAALHGQVEAVQALLEKGANPDAVNASEATPLLYGITDIEIVKALINHNANPNAKSKAGMTPVLAAATRGESFDIVKLLVEAGADVQVNREGPWDGGTFYRAILGGDPRTIDLMFRLEIRFEAFGKSFSPLHAACMMGDFETVKRLVEAGVDVNYSDDGWGDAPGHAFNWAMWAEHHDIAAYLLDHGTDLNFAPTIGSQTPPMVWAGFGQGGDPMIANKLLARGLDINTVNAAGESALTYALKSGKDTKLTHYLLEQGALLPKMHAPEKALPSRTVPPIGKKRDDVIRNSAQRAVTLMQSSSETFLQRKSSCASCHHQILPALTYQMAMKRDLKVDMEALGHQLQTQMRDLASDARSSLMELVSGPFSAGQGLMALHALGCAPEGGILDLARYLRETQRFDGTWFNFGRPPMDEPSSIPMTAWAIRGMSVYPRVGEEAATSRSIHRAMESLRNQIPANLHQRNTLLLGLHWGGQERSSLMPYANELIKMQRADGGWAQLSTLESDAWATGLTLYTLWETGALSPNDPVFQTGIEYLVKTQFEDGSWWVKSRGWPFQPHFDSGFPHGKDQWISIGATAWATMALLATIEPVKSKTDLPTGQELIALWEAKQKIKLAETEIIALASQDSTVDFVTEISPILERSCLSCHSGERAKGKFRLNSREDLMKGGHSDLSSVKLGDAIQSPLIQFVTDQVEDMEMPPLDKRGKYPALNADEIEKLTTWIDEGAHWPEGVVLE